MTISKDENSGGVGMFNFIKGATIKNVKLTDASVTGGYSVGLLVGNAGVEVSSVSMSASIGNLIGNCTVSGQVTALRKDNQGAYAGGLIGFNDGDTDPSTGISVYSSVDGCRADVDVNLSLIHI